jgi:bifunctional non-homologous end joining protein LigD
MARKGSESREELPRHIEPMLCTLSREVKQSDDYLYEMKWDGYRIISYVENGTVRMDSRSGLDYTSKYPPIAKALKLLSHDVVLDGEVVVFNSDGNPDFDALQKYNGHSTPIKYCVFDLLWMNGKSTIEMPLTDRKSLLELLLKDNKVLLYSMGFSDGPALYNEVLAQNLEGIVAKRKDSPYRPGARGNDWLKIPTKKRQEFVIGGWAESERGRSFRSLLFGAYENGKLTWIGRSGGGFKDKEMPGILKQLTALETKASPFSNNVLDTKGAIIHWVKPKLVANFEFATWTKSGRIRKPATFLGFRMDKEPEQVVREIPKEVNIVSEDKIDTGNIAKKSSLKSKASKIKYLNEGSNWQRVDEAEQGKPLSDFAMENCTITVHDIDRELWEGIPKAKLILYYNNVSKFILPHLKDRPQSLNLKLTHAGGPTTFIKDMENRQPSCSSIFPDERRVHKKGKRDQIDYLICNNIETLVYMIDCGCVDINPWASRSTSPETPDYIWIDLDPTVQPNPISEEAGFKKAVEIAMAAKEILDRYKLKSFVKTSGKTGLHIYIPCMGINFNQSRRIANMIGDEIHAVTKNISTRSETISKRGNSVYIDANQNDYADTIAAPYSIRPYHQPLVSTPLEWKEIKNGLNRYDFNIDSIDRRLKKEDIFIGVLDKKIAASNTKKLKNFDEQIV